MSSLLDVDECGQPASCDPNANCTNTVGSFTCVCNQGYSGDGTTCNGKRHAMWGFLTYPPLLDINECDGNPCDMNATCDNTVGSFTCICIDGFTGNGITCNGKELGWIFCLSM